MKYIGVKMPSRPASTMAFPQRFNASATRVEPRGVIRSCSITLSELCVTQRPSLDLRNPAIDNPEPIRG